MIILDCYIQTGMRNIKPPKKNSKLINKAANTESKCPKPKLSIFMTKGLRM